MTLSLVYQMKRRRLVSLMLLVLGLLVVALIMVPGWQPAGPVYAETVGDAYAVVIVEPVESYRISWRRPTGVWEESEPFQGRITATMGGDTLVIFHGLSYTTYRPGKDGSVPYNERWDRFTPGWSVQAAARTWRPPGGAVSGRLACDVDAWAFGTIDERTIVCAFLKNGAWFQGPELKRPAAVTDLVAASGDLDAWLWWREGSAEMGASLTGEPRDSGTSEPPPSEAPRATWGQPRVFEVPADARCVAATGADGPALFAVTGLKKKICHVHEITPSGHSRQVEITQDPPLRAAIDSISVADGDSPPLAAVSGLAAHFAFTNASRSFDDLSHTLFRFRPGAVPWFTSMMFASLSIVGIGVSLLFERRRITPEKMVEQARMLSGVAPLVARAFAAGVDTGPFLWGFAWLAVEAGVPPVFSWVGAISLCCAYHAAAEAAYGQTLGKKLAGISVRRTDGTPASTARILVRNIVRGLELMFPLLPAVVMISTKRSQRLGDLVAGTMVVRVEKEPQPEREEA